MDKQQNENNLPIKVNAIAKSYARSSNESCSTGKENSFIIKEKKIDNHENIAESTDDSCNNCDAEKNPSNDDDSEATEKKGGCRNIIEKVKSMKNYKIFVALVIAAVIILIYFSVNAIVAKPKADDAASLGKQSQLEKVLSQIEGVGYCSVVITYNKNGDLHQSNEIESGAVVSGVVIVAEGGDNGYVKIKLTDAMCALLEIKGNNIKIYKSQTVGNVKK